MHAWLCRLFGVGNGNGDAVADDPDSPAHGRSSVAEQVFAHGGDRVEVGAGSHAEISPRRAAVARPQHGSSGADSPAARRILEQDRAEFVAQGPLGSEEAIRGSGGTAVGSLL